MQVLVIGSGGREHALVWKLRQSPRVRQVFCAPGNAGIGQLATRVAIAADDIEGLARFARTQGIDLTVVGPEVPLSAGVVDHFQSLGLKVFGPSRAAAELEGSKVYCKDFFKKYKIPSAGYQVFSKLAAAKKYIKAHGAPLVVKADGLAAGKGVVVARSVEQALEAVEAIMSGGAFGAAGARVVIEDCLQGEEVSYLAFTDGKTLLPLPSSQDHKAVNDNDQGPNTGGMGAYSPAPALTPALEQRVLDEVMLPTIRGMAAEGRPYKGVLYAGLMLDGDDIQVLEFNCRFGDPECQPLLMRLKSDLVEIVEAVIEERLDRIRLEIDPRPAVCVVMASGGYPGHYDKGQVIKGLAKAAKCDDVMVFHAGTDTADKRIVTAGGRVLGVTALGKNIAEAIRKAYGAVEHISWPGCHFRRDIGHRALRRLASHQGPRVGILMGSDSDLPSMRAAAEFFERMGVACELRIASAHRTPELVSEYARTAAERGLQCLIAGAGMAAHLAGVVAAHTELPVIGVPLDASPLQGLDALLSTVQMPPGIPVATMGIGKSGARNAAVFACRMLALNDQALAARLVEFRQDMIRQVEEKNAALGR
ncbi:MAG: 5-(carboxyamino)imidazole ribonucleotide mutase [Desulfobulbaceae bacterium A2]|nr:MAG: 5-(carboxyamino)imidazole ribonucleotide mutase [Desulfobulbaceae bacterium A2]